MKLSNFCNYRLGIFLLVVYRKVQTSGKNMTDKSFVFLRIRMLIVRKYHFMLMRLIYIDIETHISPWIQSSFLPFRSLLRSSCFYWITRSEKIHFCSLYQIVDSLNFLKRDFTFDLSRHSKSSFSVTTSFISSTTVGIQKFLFLGVLYF